MRRTPSPEFDISSNNPPFISQVLNGVALGSRETDGSSKGWINELPCPREFTGAEKNGRPDIYGTAVHNIKNVKKDVHFVGGLSIQTIPTEARQRTPAIMKDVT